MSEQQTEVKQPAMAIPPEAGVSITFKVYDQNMNDVQVTMRGATAADWAAVLKQRKALIDATAEYGWKPFEAHRPQPQSTPPQNGATTQNAPSAPTTQGQSGLTFTANILCVEFNSKNGEKVAKLKGGQWTKHGVRLWPETAQSLGFDLAQYNAGDHGIAPINVCYVLNDKSQPAKIIGLAA